MKTKVLSLIVILSCVVYTVQAQVAINDDETTPDPSAILDISSGNKGLLIPRLQINSIDSQLEPVEQPANGLIIYNTGSMEVPEGIYMWSDAEAEWVELITSKEPVIQGGYTAQAGEIYEDNVGGTPSVISMPYKNNYKGWVTADEGALLGSVTTNTSHSTADRIIVSEPGVYEVSMTVSMQETGSNGHSENVFVTVFRTPSGGSSAATHVQYRSDESYDYAANGSSQGLLQLNAGDALDLRLKSDEDNTNLYIYHASLIVKKMGE